MSINFIPNDPSAGTTAPALRVQAKHANRPASRATFSFSNTAAENRYAPGTAGFVYWQCREAALAAIDGWEGATGNFSRWQGNRRTIALRQDAGVDLNAYYDRASVSFFHYPIQGTAYFSGASTDVVAHEVGHALLDAIRPQLWDAAFLEAGAFHEAFGDCIAVLTALNDRDTRTKLLAQTATLKKKNFVESTAENLSDGIRRLAPDHNAAEPRHAWNDFLYQIPETLPFDGGPGELINEVHSFGMLFSGCFYDLIAGIFAAQPSRTQATLLTASRTAGALLAEGARTAIITPRFFQSVGRAMILADEQKNGGANRDRIRAAFERHAIMLGANALLAPTTVLAGGAPTVGRAASIGRGTRADLSERLGVRSGSRLTVGVHELCGRRFAHVEHVQRVALGGIDGRLRGVSIPCRVPVLVGETGGQPAVMGELPELTAAEREVRAFVESLLRNDQIESTRTATGRDARGTTPRRGRRAICRETHRVASVGGRQTLVRMRFHCRCPRPSTMRE
jgi:hypothetical protein